MEDISQEELYNILRGEIMYYAALDHLDKVGVQYSWQILNKGKHLFKSFINEYSTTDMSTIDISMLKHKLAFLLSYGNELYRRDNLDESLEVCQRIYDIVKKAQISVGTMHGMMARTCVQLAKPYRQKMEYEKAREYYAEAIESTHRQAEIKALELANQPEKLDKELSYYRRRSIMILAAGSGYINIASGNFNRAAMVLWPMRTAMLHDQDKLSQTFIKMLTASINRARAGSDRSMLEKACLDLEESYRIFHEYGHVRYMRPTLYELVLGLIYLRQWDKADHYTNILRKLPRTLIRDTNNQRWEIIAGLLEGISHKYQGNYAKALESAEKAMGSGNAQRRGGTQNRRSRIEVAILSGEALFHLKKYKDAEKKFREAKELYDEVSLKHQRVLSDKHLLIAAQIYLALIALNRDQVDDAYAIYEEVKSSQVEHRWVVDLLKELEVELVRSGSKLIISNFHRPYKEIQQELQDWLVRRLEGIYGRNAKQIAAVLQERRQNVGQWMNRSLGHQPVKKRRSRKKRKDKTRREAEEPGDSGHSFQ